jgi:hypothetical protein
MTERKIFESLVNPDIASAVQFRYGEGGNPIQKGEITYYVHTGFVSNLGGIGKGLHIIIGERHVGKDNSTRLWYFGTFEAHQFLEMTDEERQKYDQAVLDTLVHKNRVPGRKLESLIKKARMAY